MIRTRPTLAILLVCLTVLLAGCAGFGTDTTAEAEEPAPDETGDLEAADDSTEQNDDPTEASVGGDSDAAGATDDGEAAGGDTTDEASVDEPTAIGPDDSSDGDGDEPAAEDADTANGDDADGDSTTDTDIEIVESDADAQESDGTDSTDDRTDTADDRTDTADEDGSDGPTASDERDPEVVDDVDGDADDEAPDTDGADEPTDADELDDADDADEAEEAENAGDENAGDGHTLTVHAEDVVTSEPIDDAHYLLERDGETVGEEQRGGTATFEGLADGEYELSVHGAAGDWAYDTTVTVDGDDVEHTAEVDRMYVYWATVEATVVDADGEPVEGETVTFNGHETPTDEDGVALYDRQFHYGEGIEVTAEYGDRSETFSFDRETTDIGTVTFEAESEDAPDRAALLLAP